MQLHIPLLEVVRPDLSLPLHALALNRPRAYPARRPVILEVNFVPRNDDCELPALGEHAARGATAGEVAGEVVLDLSDERDALRLEGSVERVGREGLVGGSFAGEREVVHFNALLVHGVDEMGGILREGGVG